MGAAAAVASGCRRALACCNRVLAPTAGSPPHGRPWCAPRTPPTFLSPAYQLCTENGEAIQILKYVDGQKYEPHTDYFRDK